MTVEQYTDAQDGDLLVRASTLNAALSRYHEKYLEDKGDEGSSSDSVNFSPFFDEPASNTDYWRLLTEGTITEDNWLSIDGGESGITSYISVFPHAFVVKDNYTLLIETRNMSGECTFMVHGGLVNALTVQTPTLIPLTEITYVPLIGIKNINCTQLCEFEFNVPANGHVEIRLSIYQDNYSGTYNQYDEFNPEVILHTSKYDGYLDGDPDAFESMYNQLTKIDNSIDTISDMTKSVNALGPSYIYFDKNADDATGTMRYRNTKFSYLRLPECEFEREGYVFGWWSTVQEEPVEWVSGVNKFNANYTYKFSSSVTLYAWWLEANATLNFYDEYAPIGDTIDSYGIRNSVDSLIMSKPINSSQYIGPVINDYAENYSDSILPGRVFGGLEIYPGHQTLTSVYSTTFYEIFGNNDANISFYRSQRMINDSGQHDFGFNYGDTILYPNSSFDDTVGYYVNDPNVDIWHVFSGWYSDKNGKGIRVDGPVHYNKIISDDASILPLIFYPYIELKRFTVSFVVGDQGGTYTTPDPITNLIYTDVVHLPEVEYDKGGKVLDCWRTRSRNARSKKQQGNIIRDGMTVQEIAQSIGIGSTTTTLSIMAMFEASRLKLRFYANGGEGTMANQTIADGTTATITACTFTPPENMQFLNWNTKSDGTGVTYTDEQELTGYYADIDLYAQWAEVE